jgi:hypothetical protein
LESRLAWVFSSAFWRCGADETQGRSRSMAFGPAPETNGATPGVRRV